MSFRCPYLPSSLKLVLLISIPTSFIFPAHSQTFANPSLPDAPTPQASNELAQDAAAQNGQRATRPLQVLNTPLLPSRSHLRQVTASGGASISSATGTENESAWKSE